MGLIRWAVIFALFIAVYIAQPVYAKDFTLEIEGKCMDYNITVSGRLEEGCYDVKIDVTTPAGRVGEIFDLREGWKSSFFYVKEAFCIGKEEANKTVNETFHVRANTPSGTLHFAGKLKSGSETLESGFYELEQDCPELPVREDGFAIVVTLVVIVILLAGITLYVKVWK